MSKKNYLFGFTALCFTGTLYLFPWRRDWSPSNIVYMFFFFPIVGGSFLTFGLVSGFMGLLI